MCLVVCVWLLLCVVWFVVCCWCWVSFCVWFLGCVVCGCFGIGVSRGVPWCCADWCVVGVSAGGEVLVIAWVDWLGVLWPLGGLGGVLCFGLLLGVRGAAPGVVWVGLDLPWDTCVALTGW